MFRVKNSVKPSLKSFFFFFFFKNALKVYICHYIIGTNLTHQWQYKFNKPQWPYHSLSDRGMVTGGPGQKPD